ncbi:putative methionine--tRNA ligase [Helianthus annuus]|nr:putative methionine--tRNA ligase [Helianthus annuus]KAJ0533642.1 putative methionine--tRNA ligase [Helianthus annuus]KAJ0541883.1 putative methionine--tRNA ligase [Helianthus annuus]KAJ0706958.1 putative methionine--tRNA ligase [Helianthus annuus]KAJ0710979.1 putative methionine--tRNA ligase [Helianthus annuus]
MAARVHHSLQSHTTTFTTFFFPKSINKTHNKWFSPSSRRSPTALYCTCSSTSSQDPFVLTTPLYYVNAPPHMGSAYSTIAADAIARFQRLIGKKVIFITGTDEHGEKIATAAAAGGSTPNDHCDAISQSYRALWKDLDISYDKFIRTTDPKHEAIVEEFYSKVLANGDIYRADYEGLYCVNCEEYKDEKELLENNCCPMHLKPCVSRKEDNYFFALSKYQKKLEDILEHNPDFVQPLYRLNEVQNWMKSGLKDFSISRASVDWGIRVPNDPKQTIYVWFDALLGYISALSDDHEQPSLQTAISSGWPASLHLIGKDILRFHAVYWPAMLMSAGLSLPNTVFGHGFLTKDGMKMGKSLGNTLEPKELVQRFGPDAVRYFFLREVEFGNDGDYSEERFINIVNAHLANTIGNLLNRTLGLLKKNCQSTLVADSSDAAEGIEFKDTVEKLVEESKVHYESLQLSSACESVMEIGNAGNLYIDARAPWSLFKQGGESFDSAAKDLVLILEAVRIIAVALSPVTPNLCLRIYRQLGYTDQQFHAATWSDTNWGGLKGGQVMAPPTPIFARIETVEEAESGPATEKKVSKKKEKASRSQSTIGA